MKIIILGSAHPLRGGGISTFNERMAAQLGAEGHEAEIWSFSLQYPALLFPGKSQHTDEPAPEGIKIRSLINSVNPANWISVGRQLRRARPDVIIVRFWTPFMGPAFGTILRIAKKNGHSRVVCIADNVLPHEGKVYDPPFTKYFIPAIDSFLVMSREVQKDLKKLTNAPSLYSPHPLYDNYGAPYARTEALKQLQLPTNKKYLLFFGFIRKYKGLDLLLEAMALLKDEHIHLIVAGEYYGDKEMYEGIIAKHSLESRVHLFTDFIPNDEVGIYFSACDAVALPYRSATQSGITQVAYYFEKGMIATDVGGLPEAVQDGVTGIICQPDPASIAAAIPRFFDDGNDAVFATGAQRLKHQFSWASFSAKLLESAAGAA